MSVTCNSHISAQWDGELVALPYLIASVRRYSSCPTQGRKFENSSEAAENSSAITGFFDLTDGDALASQLCFDQVPCALVCLWDSSYAHPRGC